MENARIGGSRERIKEEKTGCAMAFALQFQAG